MRVISGYSKGCRLFALSASGSIRPTTDRVKEALFSSIQFDVKEKIVLDLFAGSGQLGIEALSRGAKSCFFVDISKNSIDVIHANVKKAKVDKSSFIYKSDWLEYLNKNDILYDLVFLDPPYKMGIDFDMIEKIKPNLNCGAKVICEISKKDSLSFNNDDFEVIKEKIYSSSKIIILLRKV